MKHILFKMEHSSVYLSGVKLLSNFNMQIYQGRTLGIICSNVTEEQALLNMFSGNCQIEGNLLFSGCSDTDMPDYKKFHHMFFVVGNHMNLIKNLSIAENICIFSDSNPMIHSTEYRVRTAQLFKDFHIDISVDQQVVDLEPWEQLLVVLIKAYNEHRKVIVLNNITDFITDSEFQIIDSVIRKMVQDEFSFVMIDSLESRIFDSASEILVIKGGTSVACFSSDFIDRRSFYKYMLPQRKQGQESPFIQHNYDDEDGYVDPQPFLSFNHISTNILHDVSFDVFKGELIKILCLDEITLKGFHSLIFGESQVKSGKIIIGGAPHQIRDIVHAMKQGICWCPESPYKNAIVPSMSLRDNMMLPLSRKVNYIWFKSDFSKNIDQFLHIYEKIDSPSAPASRFSPETLQEIAYARFLISAPKVLFVEKPFIETDLQMRETTRKMLNLLTQRGITIILLFSSISSLRLMSGDEIYIQNGRIISEDELYQIFYGS